jgi:MipA family protein
VEKKTSIRPLVLAAGAALATLSAGAQAQGFLEIDNVPTFIGAAVGVLPDYRGSDEYTWGIAPYFRYQFKGSERYVSLVANEFSLNVLNSRSFRFGPVANYTFGRDGDDIDDDKVSEMEDIDDTVEAGLFAEYAWINPQNPRNRFLVGVTGLWDLGDESDGFRTRVSARYWQQVAKPLDIFVGGGFWYGDEDWNDHYFGVNADNVGDSGLPFHEADSGVNEYFVIAGGLFYLSKSWVLSGGVRYSRISGDAADSPIVDDRGDENQWTAGLGIGYIMW